MTYAPAKFEVVASNGLEEDNTLFEVVASNGLEEDNTLFDL